MVKSPVVSRPVVTSPGAGSRATDSPAMVCPATGSPVTGSPVTGSPGPAAPDAAAPGPAAPDAAPPGSHPRAWLTRRWPAGPHLTAGPRRHRRSPPHPAGRAAWPPCAGRPAAAGPPARRARPAHPGRPHRRARPAARAVDMDLAAEFIQLHRREVPGAGPAGPRLREIRREISLTGTYRHTLEELEFGARVAWRNSGRCIGRLYWKSLKVRDRREVSSAADIAAECAGHLRAATNHGRVRPTITVFAPDTPARQRPAHLERAAGPVRRLRAAGRVRAR